MHLLAHELAHVVQQGGASTGRRPALDGPPPRLVRAPHARRDRPDAAAGDPRPALRPAHGGRRPAPIPLRQETAHHVLRQERERLRQWQANEPKSLDDVDPAWQVHAVEIRSRTPSDDAAHHDDLHVRRDEHARRLLRLAGRDLRRRGAHAVEAAADRARRVLRQARRDARRADGARLRRSRRRRRRAGSAARRRSTSSGTCPRTRRTRTSTPRPTTRSARARRGWCEQDFEGDQRYGVAKADEASMTGFENLPSRPGSAPEGPGPRELLRPGQGHRDGVGRHGAQRLSLRPRELAELGDVPPQGDRAGGRRRSAARGGERAGQRRRRTASAGWHAPTRWPTRPGSTTASATTTCRTRSPPVT